MEEGRISFVAPLTIIEGLGENLLQISEERQLEEVGTRGDEMRGNGD